MHSRLPDERVRHLARVGDHAQREHVLEGALAAALGTAAELAHLADRALVEQRLRGRVCN